MNREMSCPNENFVSNQHFTSSDIQLQSHSHTSFNVESSFDVSQKILDWQHGDYHFDSGFQSRASSDSSVIKEHWGKDEVENGSTRMPYSYNSGSNAIYIQPYDNSEIQSNGQQNHPQQNFVKSGSISSDFDPNCYQQKNYSNLNNLDMMPHMQNGFGANVSSCEFVNGSFQSGCGYNQVYERPSSVAPQFLGGHQTIENSLHFRNINCNDIHYQINEVLIPSLNDVDSATVYKASQMLYSYSKERSNILVLLSNQHLMVLLIKKIKEVNKSANQRSLLMIIGTLNQISREARGCKRILAFEGVPALVELLSFQDLQMMSFVVDTLLNLLLNERESSQVAMLKAGGLQKIISLLGCSNDKFLEIAVHCIHLLILNNKENRFIILRCNGVTGLVKLLQENSNEKVLLRTAKVLKILSNCSEIKTHIIAAGGLFAIAKQFSCPNMEVLQCSLLALKVLSDVAAKEENLDYLVQTLIQMLNHVDNAIVLDVVDVLSNLTCDNQLNKLFVLHNGGIKTLVNTLNRVGERANIAESIVRIFRHVTIRHPKAEIARCELYSYNIVPLLVKYLQPPSPWPLMKVTMGLIRNLAFFPDYQVMLGKHGAILPIAEMFVGAYEDIQKSLSAGMPPIYADEVKMDEVLKEAVETLKAMSKNAYNRSVISRYLLVVVVLAKLLFYDNENIQVIATGMLCELSSEPDTILTLRGFGAASRLSDLSKSGNQILAEQAKKLLYQLVQKEGHLLQQPVVNSDMQQVVHVNAAGPPNPANPIRPIRTSGISEKNKYSCQATNQTHTPVLQPQQSNFFYDDIPSSGLSHVMDGMQRIIL